MRIIISFSRIGTQGSIADHKRQYAFACYEAHITNPTHISTMAKNGCFLIKSKKTSRLWAFPPDVFCEGVFEILYFIPAKNIELIEVVEGSDEQEAKG